MVVCGGQLVHERVARTRALFLCFAGVHIWPTICENIHSMLREILRKIAIKMDKNIDSAS